MNKKDLYGSKIFITDPNIKRLVLNKLSVLGFSKPIVTDGNCIYITALGTVLVGNDTTVYADSDYTEVYPPEVIGMEVDKQKLFFEQMEKHSPFGWIKNKYTGKLYNLNAIDNKGIELGPTGFLIKYEDLVKTYTFIDNSPIF